MLRNLVIIPALNEERFIGPVISAISKINDDVDILVVNDGSRDRTAAIAEEKGVMVIDHTYNLGYGAALQTGFRFAVNRGYEYVITMDADGQHDPESISELFSCLRTTGADVVIGSRFSGGSYRMGFIRRVGAWIFAAVARAYTGYRFTDPTSGFQLLNRTAFSCLANEESYPLDYPDVNIILLLHKKRFKVVEAPVRMNLNVKSDTMHSGMKPFVYVIRMLLAITMILLRRED